MRVAEPALAGTVAQRALRERFLKWQCRVRQIAARERGGEPDDAIMPALTLAGETGPMGHIITVLNKAPAYEVTAELEHIAAKTMDPAQRRDGGVKFLSATYYQKAREFTDVLTATLPPASPGAETILAAGDCTLTFEAYSQRFDIACRVARLDPMHPLHRATMAHNRLFNPAMPPGTQVLAFTPDWSVSRAEP